MFILFAFDDHSAQGGANDVIGVYSTIDEAKADYKGDFDVAQIAQILDGELHVVLRAFVDTHRNPRRIDWTTLPEYISSVSTHLDAHTTLRT